MTTVADREKAERWVRHQVQQIKNTPHQHKADELASFLKYLTNLIERVEPQKTAKLSPALQQSQSLEELTSWFEQLCEFVLEAGESHTLPKMYKTSEVAKFMGVTVVTVNNWIKEGRIKGVIKEGKHAHAKIPETAIYITSSNEAITIKEIANLYQQEQKQRLMQTAEHDELLETIQFFSQKYGGTYTETLAKKDVLTPQEERDASEWKYALKKVGLLDE
ncbi:MULTISPECIES: helix-turn-helix domain-containing protein [Geobacillus thermoleovorans group]|uniref:helix-turn-helix domain-containing protein n=2 Tax=Geobacillus TaxID=129337 RepID=UPI0005AB0B34|nr:helix-turn-helix domain-containing protein [Geobacillus kaustophilus]MED4972120.1 helix-turn-helix domain-containing protein [Geobacillus thermoleovorans]